MAMPFPERPRKPRADGVRSRQSILDAAARQASIEGLEGLSIGTLAAALGMSKSGLYAHFGSKEDLELAVVDHARRIFEAEVLAPANAAPPGVARLIVHCEAYLSYLERRVFPGGCFFAATVAEFDSRTGPVRDAITAIVAAIHDRLLAHLREAQALGELPPSTDVAQLAFEVAAFLAAANAGMLLDGTPAALARARAAIDRALTAAGS
ncbi:MAG: TetR/AcrR family transcriptional regulator [Vicinamibacterales bacterium]|nr:TetR/AcrR family transcriptional regulator [Vicinamibacterales bacterium]